MTSAIFEGPDAVNGVAQRHSSSSTEYGTPTAIIEAARHVMGGITLDPASSPELNQRVGAHGYYTAEDDGFTRPWVTRGVLLNPPGGLSDDRQRPVKPKCRVTGSCGLEPGHVHMGVESSQRKWWAKLCREWYQHRTEQAVFVCFSVELLQTTQSEPRCPISPLEFAVCYPRQRLKFWRDGVERDQPPHSSCLVYLPPLPLVGERSWRVTEEAVSRFEQVFSTFGRVVVPRQSR